MAYINYLTIVMQLLGTAVSLFYHEPSFTMMRPKDTVDKMTDFGFSLAYQPYRNLADEVEKRLIVGSPHGDMDGRVYDCPINDDFKKVDCNKFHIDVKKYASDYAANYTKQPYCLGTAVAATESFFITCAPLWTTTGVIHCTDSKDNSTCVDNWGAHGTCFIYYGPQLHRFKGLLEQFKLSDNNKNNFILGGLGLSLLADPENEVVLIGKPAVYGDILYIDSTRTLNPAQSLFYNNKTKESAEQYFTQKFKTNIGYATTSGKFFSGENDTAYAFSFQDSLVQGHVGFLHYDRPEKLLTLRHPENPVTIIGDISGSMFGAALHGADVNRDGVTDLLVGAPAYNLAERYPESGALYIYLGGDENIDDRKRTILGAKPGSRFGTAIATADIDGDALPEIFVSAPFEDSEIGVVYILSGYEVERNVIKFKTSDEELSVLNLKFTQRLQMKEFRWFGFSLQVVPDIDDNGCDELAVGSPGGNAVLLFRCIPAITATVYTNLLKEVIKKTDKQFDVEVCVVVSNYTKHENTSLRFPVESVVSGNGVKITNNARFDIDLKSRSNCKNVTVVFTTEDVGLYHFSAKMLSNDDILNATKAFVPTWVRLSPYSNLESSFNVTRGCSDADCSPHLSMTLLWVNRPYVKEQYVDSNLSENVTVSVINHGAGAYDACLRLGITGVQVLSIPCDVDDHGMYKCILPRPLAKNKEYRLDILVGIDKVSMDDTMIINANLFNNCNFPNSTNSVLNVKFIFISKDVYILGNSHNLSITDTQIMDVNRSIVEDRQEYLIANNGSLDWPHVNIFVSVAINKVIQNFTIVNNGSIDRSHVSVAMNNIIQKFTVSIVENGNCLYQNKFNDSEEYPPAPALPAFQSLRVIILYKILKNRIQNNLIDNKIEIESQIKVRMRASRAHDSKNTVKGRQTTTIIFIKELSLGNNKGLIIFLAIFAAILILGALGCVLYKIGFFKRKEKERLDTLKASFRSNENPFMSGGAADKHKQGAKGDDQMEDDFDIEVIEDCSFEPVPLSNDEAALIAVKTSKEDSKATKEEPIKDAVDANGEKNDCIQNKSTPDNAPLIVEEIPKMGSKEYTNHTKL